jgi:hypothetical protein
MANSPALTARSEINALQLTIAEGGIVDRCEATGGGFQLQSILLPVSSGSDILEALDFIFFLRFFETRSRRSSL